MHQSRLEGDLQNMQKKDEAKEDTYVIKISQVENIALAFSASE